MSSLPNQWKYMVFKAFHPNRSAKFLRDGYQAWKAATAEQLISDERLRVLAPRFERRPLSFVDDEDTLLRLYEHPDLIKPLTAVGTSSSTSSRSMRSVGVGTSRERSSSAHDDCSAQQLMLEDIANRYQSTKARLDACENQNRMLTTLLESIPAPRSSTAKASVRSVGVSPVSFQSRRRSVRSIGVGSPLDRRSVGIGSPRQTSAHSKGVSPMSRDRSMHSIGVGSPLDRRSIGIGSPQRTSVHSKGVSPMSSSSTRSRSARSVGVGSPLRISVHSKSASPIRSSSSSSSQSPSPPKKSTSLTTATLPNSLDQALRMGVGDAATHRALCAHLRSSRQRR